MFKKLLCISAALVLCFSSFIVPSFGLDYFTTPINQTIYDGTDPTAPIATATSMYSYTQTTGGTVRYATYYWTSSNDSTYAFYYILNNTYYLCVASDNPFRYSYYITYIVGNQTTYNTPHWSSEQTSYDANNLIYHQEGTVSSANSSYSDILFYVPQFNSLNDGLTALRNYLDNPPTPTPTDPNYNDLPDFYIQRGYAAYIDFGSDWSTRSCSGTLTSTFPQYSSLISGDWDGTDNRRYFWTDSLPINTSFSSNVGNAIDWTKVAPYDLLQRSKNGIWFIQSNSPQNRYLVIVNPNQWRYGQTPTEDTLNSSIKVSDLSGSTGDVQFFALNQQFDQTGTLVSSASDTASNNRTGTYDPDTDTWTSTDSSGNAADQIPGGMSDTPVVSSITDYISNITNILTNFANSVISLIQAPISHVAQLIEAGSGFMGALRGLYGWLPVDIQGLVISALTVVIGIGVFKVFL